jgi:hypothetical protein
MRPAVLAVILLAVLALSGCTFRSSTILPDPMLAGDEIEGFGRAGDHGLENYDRGQRAFVTAGRIAAELVGDGVRYRLTPAEAGEDEIVFRAQKLGERTYLLRYREGSSNDRDALAFLVMDNRHYFVLSGITDQALLDAIFAGGPYPRGSVTSAIEIDDMATALRLAAYLGAERAELSRAGMLAEFRLAD